MDEHREANTKSVEERLISSMQQAVEIAKATQKCQACGDLVSNPIIMMSADGSTVACDECAQAIRHAQDIRAAAKKSGFSVGV